MQKAVTYCWGRDQRYDAGGVERGQLPQPSIVDNWTLHTKPGVAEEEEEQIFDNEDGSITQIHKGKKVVESIKILNFEDYFKK